MKKLSIQDLDLQNKKVLMRVDFNVPLNEKGEITDDTRIKQSLPSIEYILAQNGKLILLSHFGRPKGKKDSSLSLAPCAKHLSELLGKPVQFAPDCIGEKVKEMADQLQEGEILLLENLRFHTAEEHPEADPSFAKQLAKLGDCYINDAFGSAHRRHASTALLPTFFEGKAAAGFLMEKEINALSSLILTPKRPFHVLIGGAKVSTKIGVLDSLLEKVDCIYIGGGMAYTFLKAQGIKIGDSICDEEYIPAAKEFIKKCTDKMIQLQLPKDLLTASEINIDAQTNIVTVKEGIENGWKGVDIGPKTIESWISSLQNAATVFWNGPMGVFEIEPFSKGTKAIAEAISNLSAITMIGGGDSVAAVNHLNLNKSFTHISTGGGASLEFLQFGHLPGIDALSNR
ncbi:MAG: hypothetical protein Tsb0015_10090 [Simkaniaceae bacterium]